MKYLVVQDWSNTRGNHAGMEHMCDMLVERWPNEYTKICKSEPSPIIKRDNFLLRKLLGRYDKYIRSKKWKEEYMKLCKVMFESLKSGDEVFLLEYNWLATSQLEIAKYIKNNFNGIRVHALSHITPTTFKRLHAEKYILEWSKYVDTELTLGSSLSSYFVECGIPQSKISTGYHYVDNNYYKPLDSKNVDEKKKTIIAIGALQRDFQTLAEIVNSTTEVNWIICKGRKHVDHLFKGANIRLVGYVQEEELRRLMSDSDISINILEDTVGSNVITTSMAMGLAIIVTNVGSIRDYCNEDNAIFCKYEKEYFIHEIKKLCRDNVRLHTMKNISLKESKRFGIENIHTWFSNL